MLRSSSSGPETGADEGTASRSKTSRVDVETIAQTRPGRSSTAYNKRKSWFLFVQQLLEIGRERFIAVVDEDMADRITTIRDNIDDFDDYKRTPIGDHHKNLPAAYAVAKNSMVSIKTTEDHGNVQLTVGKGTDPESGEEAWLLDTDIDENGKLLAHLGDLFKHRFTGGTHPIDIHEYLALAHPGIDVGYDLL